jgi:hypothetical protein
MTGDKILIIVEGKTDSEIIENLIVKNNIFDKDNLEFLFDHGINEVYKYVENLSTINLITQNKVKRVLIIVDCDEEDPKNRFLRIINILNKQWKDLKKYNLSEVPTVPGVVSVEHNKVGVGVFILPDNRNKGCLETLCLKSFENINILSCLDDYVNCLSNKGVNFNHNKIAKIKVRNYINTINPDTYSAELIKETNFLSSSFDELKIFLGS